MNGKKDRMITEIKEGGREKETDTVGERTVSGCGTCKPTAICYVQKWENMYIFLTGTVCMCVLEKCEVRALFLFTLSIN